MLAQTHSFGRLYSVWCRLGRNPRADFDRASTWRVIPISMARTWTRSTIGFAMVAKRAVSRGAVITARDISGHLDPTRPLLVAFSHEDYLVIGGGTQLCIGLEQLAAQKAQADYLHVYPLRGTSELADGVQPTEPWVGLSLNGTPMGGSHYLALRRPFPIPIPGGASFTSSSITDGPFARITSAPWSKPQAADVSGGSMTSSPSLKTERSDFRLPFERRSQRLIPALKDAAAGRRAISAHLRLLWRCAVDVDRALRLYGQRWRAARPIFPIGPSVSNRMCVSIEARRAHPLRHVRTFSVRFCGRAPVANKGWEAFRSLVQAKSQQADFEFHYYGAYDIDLDVPIHRVHVTGADPLAMVRALREDKIDVLLHLTRVPETYL